MSGSLRKPRGDGSSYPPPARGIRSRRGFALIELAIALSILVIGLVSIVSATSRMHHLRHQNRDRALAQNGLRSISERIHARSHGFSADPATWSSNLIPVFAPGGAIGDTFDVEGLNLAPGAQVIGTIQIVIDETATDQQLNAQIGMPRDLNGDGQASNTDVSQNACMLPVIVRLQWRGQSGVQGLTHAFYVMGY